MTLTQIRTTRNSQRTQFSARARSSLTPARRSTTFGTSARASSVFRPIGSGAESISAHRPRTPREDSTAFETEEANTTARERNSPGLEYIDGTEDLPDDPPDPDDGDDGNDGDPPDDPPADEPPANPHQNENERFLHVMSDLAAGIRTQTRKGQGVGTRHF